MTGTVHDPADSPAPARMLAAVQSQYGPPEVLRVAEVERPEPGPGDVLVRVHASTVTSGDARARACDVPRGMGLIGRLVFGVFRPRKPILGTEFAGTVAAVGIGVTRFAPGDRVFGFPGGAFGGCAEYLRLPADGRIAPMPAGLTYAEAASLPFGASTAISFLEDLGRVQPGERVLVYGASGGVGVAVVQLARHLGAEVTGVCGPANVELVRSLGAHHVIDYTAEDFTDGGPRFDVVVETVGKASFGRCRRVLVDGGRCLLVSTGIPGFLAMAWTAVFRRKRAIAGVAAERPEDLERMRVLAEAGHLRPVIDRCLPLESIVEAHRHVDTGHKRGSVVILMPGVEAGDPE